MFERSTVLSANSVSLVMALLLSVAPMAQAQKIVCWKDKTGKLSELSR